MGYKDKKKQSAYQAARQSSFRVAWLALKGPCVCGEIADLQVDHVDPRVKWTHRIWSYGKEKREAELSKCQVLCIKCHKKKTAEHDRFFSGKAKKKATSQYKGVYWDMNLNKWRATIKIQGVQKHLGVFTNEKEAAKVYDSASLVAHPSGCFLNLKQ